MQKLIQKEKVRVGVNTGEWPASFCLDVIGHEVGLGAYIGTNHAYLEVGKFRFVKAAP